ncbi:hypothetical protein [Halpernia sp.]|uniref:hypothetical protein n=1 Tax=Halpernia sp. TaxID=2782209 RepID=UPI003A93DBF4
MNKLFFKKYFYKYTNKEKYRNLKEEIRFANRKSKLTSDFYNKISEIQKNIKEEKTLNFKHSGHIGDVMYALPVIQELSKTHTCNLVIQVNKPTSYAHKHTSGNVYINEKLFSKFLPLLDNIKYLNKVKKLENQKIHIDLDLFREFPFQLNFITVRWFSQLTAVFPDFSKPCLEVEPHSSIKNKVVIIRTFRARNSFVDYSFLKNYDDLLFVGLPDEYEDLKKSVPNLEFYDVKDFLELAQMIKASRFYLGNQSFGFAVAECLKVPRLLEAYADFPVVHPIGGNGADFYFQQHFEELFDTFYKL